jgi:isocitrate lyase
MGYAFQFVTLAGFHALNLSMFELSRGYRDSGMAAYSKLQDREFELAASQGYAAIKHQSFVGTGWFDALQEVISGGESATRALEHSTEKQQF